MQSLEASWVRTGRLVYSIILGAATIFFVVWTLRWPWMWDASIMHYVNFLMDHGMVLYRDIIDMNMPGAYFIEGWALHVFGTGDIAARMYEFFLLASLTGAMVVIARPYDWFAGFFAGVLFILAHAGEGPINSVQREEVMTVLIMVAYALVFVALRSRRPVLMLPFGFLAGLATSLKPTVAPLGLVLLGMAIFELRRRKIPFARYAAFGFAGLIGAFLVVVEFFIRTHAFGAFLDCMRHLLPYYAGLQKTPYLIMIGRLGARALIALLPFALVVTLVNKDWKNWERWALAVGVGFGLFSYFAQHKGFLYHRYPALAFLLLWIGLEFAWATRQTGWVRAIGFVGFSLGVLYVVPMYVGRVAEAVYADALPNALERDLTRLGTDRLQHQVQCIDMVSGCVNALYRLHLVQSTGFLGDFMFFPTRGYAPSPYYRAMFLDEMHSRKPLAVVVTNAWFNEQPSFDKLQQWPEFIDFLNANYTLAVTRQFTDKEQTMGPAAYKIYVLNGGGLPAGPVQAALPR